MPVILGFTGSQKIKDQHPILRTLRPMKDDARSPVSGSRIERFVTGGCIGVDAFVGRWCATHVPYVPQTVVVPANRYKVEYWWRDFPDHDIEIVEMADGTSFMDRNDELIDRITELLGFPSRAPAVRSGTWSTVRRADRAGIPYRTVMQ